MRYGHAWDACFALEAGSLADTLDTLTFISGGTYANDESRHKEREARRVQAGYFRQYLPGNGGTFNCPEDDRFMLLSEHEDSDFYYGKTYLGIERSDDLVLIQVTCNSERPLSMKKAFYQKVVERLGEALRLRPEDVLISLVEVNKENWSLGKGEATYA
jgi:4-oxalocrotonate tautomerase